MGLFGGSADRCVKNLTKESTLSVKTYSGKLHVTLCACMHRMIDYMPVTMRGHALVSHDEER